MKFLMIILALASLTFFWGCSSQEKQTTADAEEELQQALPGEWEWVKTRCCFGQMETETPEDCDCSIKIIFEEDGEFREYEKGELVKSGDYEFMDFEERRGDGPRLFPSGTNLIDFSDGQPAIATLKNDTLRLDRAYMDLETRYFIRK